MSQKSFYCCLVLSLGLLWGCATSPQKENASFESLKLKLKLADTEEELSPSDLEKSIAEKVSKAQMKGKQEVQNLSNELYFKAADASLRGESEIATILFRHLVLLRPDDLFLKKKYSAELIRFGKLDLAEKVLVGVWSKEKTDEAIGTVLGNIYMALNEPKKAEETYKGLLDVHPKNAEACVLLSKSFFLQKKLELTLKTLADCEKKSPHHGIFSYYKGKFLLESKEQEKAKISFEDSLKHEPDYYQSALALGMMNEEKENWKGASEVYKKFLEKNPENYPILSRYVQVLFASEEFLKVIPYAERLSNLDPADLNLKLRLGVLYSDAKKYEEAKSVFREILVAVPDSDKVLYYLGSLYEATGEFSLAQENFMKVSKESPLFHDSSLQVARILSIFALREKDDFSKFKNFIKERGEIEPKLKFELQIVLANFFEAKEDFDEAINTVLTLKTSPTYEENHDYYLASLYERKEERTKSRGIVLDILKKNPENANALNFLGYSFLESGDNYPEAYKYISKAVSLKPSDPYIRDSLAWYHYKTGNLSQALVEMKKAWSLIKSDVTITKHLAIIYKDMRNYEEAKYFYMEALRNSKVEAERMDVLKSLESLEKVRLPASVD